MSGRLTLTGPEKKVLRSILGDGELPAVVDPGDSQRNDDIAALVLEANGGRWYIAPIGQVSDEERLIILALGAVAIKQDIATVIEWSQVHRELKKIQREAEKRGEGCAPARVAAL